MQQAVEFRWPIRVYYEDTDAGGVVYHSTYLNYLERARTEWLRTLGYEQDQLRRDFGLIFAVHSLSAEYRIAGRFNDALEVVSRVESIRCASLTFDQRLLRGDETLFIGRVKVAAVQADSMTPCRIPAPIVQSLKELPQA